MGRKIIVILAVLIIVPNLVIVTIAFLGKPPALAPLPNPNGYDDFVKAGAMVSMGTNDYTKMSHDQLAALVTSNSNALALVHLGLSRESLVPNAYSPGYLTAHVAELLKLKQLAQLLAASGRLAELEGRTNEAANLYLDGLRYGQKCSYGGVLIWRLVGIACEEIAIRRLSPLVGSLSAADCIKVSHELGELNVSEEPIANTFSSEASWSQREYGLRGRIEALVEYKSLRKARMAAQTKAEVIAKKIRTEEINFAARAYELDRGRPATNVTELVPAYLKEVPKDPATGRSLDLGP